jgi:hypothetical protein
MVWPKESNGRLALSSLGINPKDSPMFTPASYRIYKQAAIFL